MMQAHFIGIGGIGMSALARYFLASGITVSGSDEGDSVTLNELAAEGVRLFHKHDAKNVLPQNYQVVYSEAIRTDNPERVAARKMGIPEKSYFAALGDISRTKKTVAICGTHGKSTTTAMAGLALTAAGKDPLVILGTKVFEWDRRNIRLPEADPLCLPPSEHLFIVESCEYHNSFLHLQPQIVVVTNIEPDHLDFFGTAENYYAAFRNFVKKIPPDGRLIADFSDKRIAKLLNDTPAKKVDASTFLAEVPELLIPGKHYRQNAATVLALSAALEIPPDFIRQSLAKFRGTWRRFEFKGETEGRQVYDDYAHHPTEISATLAAFREKFPERKLWAVFQPHQYSRTREFLDEFAGSFTDADEVLIPNIYRVRDTDADVAAVSAEILTEKIRSNGKNARHTGDFEKAIAILQAETVPGDVIISMGAGPVHKVAEGFLKG